MVYPKSFIGLVMLFSAATGHYIAASTSGSTSLPFFETTSSTVCLQFYYHMSGAFSQELDVRIEGNVTGIKTLPSLNLTMVDGDIVVCEFMCLFA